MQVERNKTPEQRKLVRCRLFEATHFMSGQPIVKLIRDTTGWLAYSNDGIAESHIREDGIAYVFHPDDIAESDFHAGKYEIDPAEDTVTITLNAQEAATLQTILGKFNSLNDSEFLPVLGTLAESRNLFSLLREAGIKSDRHVGVVAIRAQGTPHGLLCSGLSLKNLDNSEE